MELLLLLNSTCILKYFRLTDNFQVKLQIKEAPIVSGNKRGNL